MNPYSLTFGKEPLNAIRRDKQLDEVLDGMTEDNPEFQVCMITGVRGSGKTVFMTEISKELRKNKDWIVVELSTERDMLHALAAQLSNRKELLQIFKDAKLNLSVLGFGLQIDSEPPITDTIVALDRMLNHLTKRNKKVLVTVDEVVSNQHIREFTSQFQIYIRKNYQVFLLMTGLYENIHSLQNEKTLTFLYRAPKFAMSPLNTALVAKQYKQTLNISDDQAGEMAKLVKGYPYAYQVLGYLCFKRQCPYYEIIDEFDAYLDEYVYEKIWSEMSHNDQVVLKAIAQNTSGKISDIRKTAKMSSEKLSVYRNRLIKKGIITNRAYGYLEFTLPRFCEFVTSRS